jgi:hypothetical protein
MEGGLIMFDYIYTVESGAAKKRKKEKENELWNSLNGEVVYTKIDDSGKE